jgi:hypothetical protein
MAGSNRIFKGSAWFFLLPLLMAAAASCDKKIDTIRKSDIESLPSQTVRDFTTTYTDYQS